MVITKDTIFGVLEDGTKIFLALNTDVAFVEGEKVEFLFCDGYLAIRPDGEIEVDDSGCGGEELTIEDGIECINHMLALGGMPELAKVFSSIKCFNP